MEIKFIQSKIPQLLVLLFDLEILGQELTINTRKGYTREEGYWFEYWIDCYNSDLTPVLFTVERDSFSFGAIDDNDAFKYIRKKKFFKTLNNMLDSVESKYRFKKTEENVYKLVESNND